MASIRVSNAAPSSSKLVARASPAMLQHMTIAMQINAKRTVRFFYEKPPKSGVGHKKYTGSQASSARLCTPGSGLAPAPAAPKTSVCKARSSKSSVALRLR